jgi:hypothetical protein
MTANGLMKIFNQRYKAHRHTAAKLGRGCL